MGNSTGGSKKISQLETVQSLFSLSNKKNVWLPAAKYNDVNNSYSNVAISLEAITSYVNSYLFSYISNIIENSNETTYVSYIINNNLDNENIIAYISGYTSNIIKNEIEKISNNVVELYSNLKNNENQHNIYASNNKKISELDSRETITKHQDHTWFPVAQYDSRTNTYHNIALNLKTITDYTNSYSYKGILQLESKINEKENEIDRILNSYIAYIAYMHNDVPISYITSYCTTYSSYLIQNAVNNITNNLTTLIEGIKNTHSNSYFRNNSKKISELKGRETITKHQDHSWLPVAQYDSRSNSYHNIAINLGTITSYVNSYSTNLLSYHLENIYNKMSYVEVSSTQWQYLEEGYEPTISLEDIQELLLTKKFVTLYSEDYTTEAFEYIKQLVNENGSILFDQSTGLIWALGKRFGGDILKKDLFYYTRINTVNQNNELTSSINAKEFESTLNLRNTNGIEINLFTENDKDIVEINLKLNEIISNTSQNDYVLFIDKNNKIGIKHYERPEISINKIDFVENVETIELRYNITSEIPIEDWNEFEVITENCQLIENDIEHKKLIIKINTYNYENDIDEIIKIKYDDGHTKNTYTLNGIFNIYCYYGYYNKMMAQYVNNGSFIINNDNIEVPFEINQTNLYYGFVRCPIKYNPIIIDNIRYMQGAWIYENTIEIYGKKYKTYLTENSGLGKIQWKIKNNI